MIYQLNLLLNLLLNLSNTLLLTISTLLIMGKLDFLQCNSELYVQLIDMFQMSSFAACRHIYQFQLARNYVLTVVYFFSWFSDTNFPHTSNKEFL